MLPIAAEEDGSAGVVAEDGLADFVNAVDAVIELGEAFAALGGDAGAGEFVLFLGFVGLFEGCKATFAVGEVGVGLADGGEGKGLLAGEFEQIREEGDEAGFAAFAFAPVAGGELGAAGGAIFKGQL